MHALEHKCKCKRAHTHACKQEIARSRAHPRIGTHEPVCYLLACRDAYRAPAWLHARSCGSTGHGPLGSRCV